MLPKIPEAKPGSSRAPVRNAAATSPTKATGALTKGNSISASSSNALNGKAEKRIPKALEGVANALCREEQLFRNSIEMQCEVDQVNVFLLHSESSRMRSYLWSRRADRYFDSITGSLNEHTTSLEQLTNAAMSSRTDMEKTRQRVDAFFEFLDSQERKDMQRLQVDNLHLRETVARQLTDLELQSAEIHTLRDQLSRRILRNSAESNFLRQLVQDEMKRATLGIEEMKKSLHARIDGAVLAFQKPSYNTALQSLRDHVDEVKQRVQDQADSLHVLVDEIGARDRFFDLEGDGGTMHTNLPGTYRKELRLMSKDQLLNVLDVVSFEDGVVDAVGKAVRARKMAAHGIRVNEEAVAGTLLDD